MLTCVIDPRNFLLLGGIDGKTVNRNDGVILDLQAVKVSKLVSTELEIKCRGNTCHVSSNGTINAVVEDIERNIKLVQISRNCEQVRVTKNYGNFESKK